MTSTTDSPVTDPPSIDPRIHERRVAIRRDQGRRRLRWAVGLATAAAVVIGGWGLLHTGPFDARVVTVTGAHPHTSGAAIVAAAGLGGHPPLVSVDPGTVAARVEALPFIATAQVGRHWPDGLTIAVTERVPSLTMAGPGTSWSILDGSGRTLEVVPSRPVGVMDLVVHGATGVLAPPPVGHTLPAAARPGLAVVRTVPLAFSAQVVSVTASPDGTLALALNSGITVRLGTLTDMVAKYEDVAAVIAHGSLQGATVIDVSVPQSPAVS